MLVLGNQLGEETNAVVGVFMRKRRDDANVSLWLNIDDKAVRRAIANILYRDVDIPPTEKIKWTAHATAIDGKKKVTPIGRQEPV